MKIKVGDEVKVIAGKDKGKTGKVITTLSKIDKVVVEGINIHKKHQKPNRTNEKGSIIEIASPIHVSNVKKIDKKETKKVVEKKEAKETKAPKTTEKKSTKKATK